MPSRRAGPATAGPSTTRIVGTTPEQSASALATRPQPSSEPIPSVIPVPVDAMTMTSGVPSTRATVAAWARLVDACSDSGDALRPPTASRLRTPPRRPAACRRRRRASERRSSPSRRCRCVTGGRRPSSLVERSCLPGRPEEREGVGSEADPCLLQRPRRQGGTEHVEQGLDRSARAGAAVRREGDDSGRQLRHVHGGEGAFRALGDGGRRNDRRAVPVDGEGGQQPDAVDLGLGHPAGRRPRGRRGRGPGGGRTLVVGGAGGSRRARRGGWTIGRRAGDLRRRAGGGPRRTAARWSAPAHRPGGGRRPRRIVRTATPESALTCCPRRR